MAGSAVAACGNKVFAIAASWAASRLAPAAVCIAASEPPSATRWGCLGAARAVAPDLSAVKRMVGASRLAFTMGSHLSASFLLSSYLGAHRTNRQR